MVIIDDSGVRSVIYAEPEKIDKSFGVSLNISILPVAIASISMVNRYINLRLNMGRELYNETKYDADIVMSIP